jgi:hypothetical protein
MRLALLVSAMVHALVVVAARAPDVPAAVAAPANDAVAPIETEIDRWAGTTALPGKPGSEEVDVDVERAPAPPAPQLPAPQPAPPTPPPATAKTAEAPAPRPTSRPAPAPSTSATSPLAASAPARRPPPARPRASAEPAGSARASASAEPGSNGDGGDFGAEEKAGIRDLGRAFTRAIPPASDSDPAWAKLPAGDAGTLTVEILVDGEGKIASFEPRDRDPPRHLVGMVKRTLAWMGSGTFALRGQVGAGSELLKLRARVSDVEVPEDKKTGGAFNLRHRFAAGRGSASFTQVGGRHVEIEVEVVRAARR